MVSRKVTYITEPGSFGLPANVGVMSLSDIGENNYAALAERLKRYEPVCLVCGKAEPCMTEADLKAGDPGIPCTFDPTPKQLYERLKACEADLFHAQQVILTQGQQHIKLTADLKACEVERDKHKGLADTYWREARKWQNEIIGLERQRDQPTADLAAARAEVERFAPGVTGDGEPVMDENYNGGWIQYTDYTALAERLKQYEPVCLVCGKSEPCMTEADIKPGDPGIPCTFDPTPKQLYERLKACEQRVIDHCGCNCHDAEIRKHTDWTEHKTARECCNEISKECDRLTEQLTADLAAARAERDEDAEVMWKALARAGAAEQHNARLKAALASLYSNIRQYQDGCKAVGDTESLEHMAFLSVSLDQAQAALTEPTS